MNIEKIKLDKIISECHKHQDRMNKAHQMLMPFFPLTRAGYEAFNEAMSSLNVEPLNHVALKKYQTPC